jgi:hypothetical protein
MQHVELSAALVGARSGARLGVDERRAELALDRDDVAEVGFGAPAQVIPAKEYAELRGLVRVLDIRERGVDGLLDRAAQPPWLHAAMPACTEHQCGRVLQGAVALDIRVEVLARATPARRELAVGDDAELHDGAPAPEATFATAVCA